MGRAALDPAGVEGHPPSIMPPHERDPDAGRAAGHQPSRPCPDAGAADCSPGRKLTGDEASPLLPEDHEKVIKEIPREVEIIELYKKIAGAGPLPPR